jgi:hypothetical protein
MQIVCDESLYKVSHVLELIQSSESEVLLKPSDVSSSK